MYELKAQETAADDSIFPTANLVVPFPLDGCHGWQILRCKLGQRSRPAIQDRGRSACKNPQWLESSADQPVPALKARASQQQRHRHRVHSRDTYLPWLELCAGLALIEAIGTFMDGAVIGRGTLPIGTISGIYVIDGTHFFEVYCGLPACTDAALQEGAQLVAGRLQ